MARIKNMKKNEWMYKGEASSINRPKNSLLNCDLEFKQLKTMPKYDENIEKEILIVVKECLRQKTFDNVMIEVEEKEVKDGENIKVPDNSCDEL